MKYELAGVMLDNCDLHEAFSSIREYLNKDALSIVELVGMETIVMAHENEEVARLLGRADMVLPDTPELLEQMGVMSDAQIDMVKRHELLHESVKLAIAERLEIFLLTENAGQMESFCSYLEETYGEELPIVETCVWEDIQADTDRTLYLVNEVNSIVPKVVVAIMDSPLQETILNRIDQMLNTKLWLSVGAESVHLSNESKTKRFYQRMLAKRKMKRQILAQEGQ